MNTNTKSSRQRIKEGDIVAIPLSNGRYAFGREFSHGLGIYDYVATSKELLPTNINRFLFIVDVYRDVMTSGIWQKIGADKQIDINSPKNHKGFVIDLINGNYEIYDFETGTSRKSSMQECHGLERVAAWDAEHITQRIEDTLNRNKSDLLNSQNWVPDLLVIDANGNIEKRIKFEEWKKL